jgi:hypothetical protein
MKTIEIPSGLRIGKRVRETLNLLHAVVENATFFVVEAVRA